MLALAAMVLFAGVAHFRPSIERSLGLNEQVAAVVRIVDGDTVVLSDGRFVRYLGIDTPEMTASGEHTRDLARRATEANRKMVEGRKVRLEFDSVRKDKYGRTLAYVYCDGKCVNAELVAQGFARAEFFRDNRRHLDEFKRIEAEAKSKRLGIWASE
jgi:micrococcal nuclease